MNKEHIESEFNKLVVWHDTHKSHKSDHLGVQKVLQYMVDNQKIVWWWSWDLIGKVNSKGDFLSHRSPARLSDLAIHYPEFVEDRKIGRYCVYRLKTENIAEINSFLHEKI